MIPSHKIRVINATQAVHSFASIKNIEVTDSDKLKILIQRGNNYGVKTHYNLGRGQKPEVRNLQLKLLKIFIIFLAKKGRFFEMERRQAAISHFLSSH
jgi:hypothetical protein